MESSEVKLKTSDDFGVMFIATGMKYINMALRSARSVRKNNLEIQIHLFTDLIEYISGLDSEKNPFTSWSEIKSS